MVWNSSGICLCECVWKMGTGAGGTVEDIKEMLFRPFLIMFIMVEIVTPL